jgi:hypothetical protein
MASDIKRVHLYHADATAFGGHIKTPFEQLIPTVAPVSLSPVGGYVLSRAEHVRVEGLVSIASAYTQVAGSVSHKTGGWTTLASSVVEGLNILNVITADRMVAQIATEHPPAGYNPKITFIGTQFQNVRIGGHLVDLELDFGLCDQAEGKDGFPQKPLFEEDSFRSAAAGQYRSMSTVPKWVKDTSIPAWVKERYTWDNGQLEKRSAVLCSVVTQVRGEFQGRPFGNVLEIPEVGKVFFGELLVDHNTYRLIGMRLELGCATSGAMAGAVVNIEGSTYP